MFIRPYQPQDQQAFAQLNRRWVERYFVMETMDEQVLYHPQQYILDKGGLIFVGEYQAQVVGTVALIPNGEGVWEMAKMTIDERFQGLGWGKILCQVAISEARAQGVKQLILYTNSRLQTAIHIYRTLGFQPLELKDAAYTRADVKMEISFLEPPIPWLQRSFKEQWEPQMAQVFAKQLQSHTGRLHVLLTPISQTQVLLAPHGKWNVMKHLGHLLLMEKLWQDRLDDLFHGLEVLRPADISNAATEAANFGESTVEEVLQAFTEQRNQTLQKFQEAEKVVKERYALHPRLQVKMGLAEQLYFVREHDLHHMQSMQHLIRQNFVPHVNR
jgi:N-acetylglutamate synthase-like GNAT family acetyltransferase/uncharacterized damage-inducible protein DinB